MGLRGRIAVVTALLGAGMILVVFHHVRTGDGVTLQSIEAMRQTAQGNHKFLMVEFSADWCSDCRLLSQELSEQKTQTTLGERFIVMNVDVGEFNRHLDVARGLGVDVNQGIPAAIFFKPDGSESSRKLGNRQILEYIREAGE